MNYAGRGRISSFFLVNRKRDSETCMTGATRTDETPRPASLPHKSHTNSEIPFTLHEQRFTGHVLNRPICQRLRFRPRCPFTRLNSDVRASWEGKWPDSWHGLCARRAPTMKQWSLDARNGDHTSRLAGYGYRAGNRLPDVRNEGQSS